MTKDVEIRDYSSSAGYLRFHFYFNNILQTTKIDINKLQISSQVNPDNKLTIYYSPKNFVDTTPYGEDYYNSNGISYTYIIPLKYLYET